ncbi:hypothetical protein MNBD_GAMMA21-561 [hydrothermal vent metagenome]|uniref:Uncharacterized protein n=1 Tax=hydrothermal vent metagenome TaxID=652676 RepID=A0A3B0ZGY5_9ZZZZ
MWIAGIISMIYGFSGGPAEISGISWTTLLLGTALWIIASIWAMTVIRGVNADKTNPNCSNRKSRVCRITTDSNGGDDDPLSEIKNLTQ